MMHTVEFREKVIPLSSRLLRFAGCFLQDKEDARDAVQDVLLKLWEKRGELARVKNLEAFTMQMTRNHCLDKIRASRTIPMSRGIESRLHDRVEVDRDQTEWKDTTDMVRQLIARLPEQQKSVILLRDIGQLEYSEIAGITGMDVNTLRVNLSRARKQVKNELLNVWSHDERRNNPITAKIF